MDLSKEEGDMYRRLKITTNDGYIIMTGYGRSWDFTNNVYLPDAYLEEENWYNHTFEFKEYDKQGNYVTSYTNQQIFDIIFK